MLKKITGATCPSCGRDNSEYNNLCTADDCPAVQSYGIAKLMKKFMASLPPTELSGEKENRRVMNRAIKKALD